MKSPQLQQFERILKALADANRLRILGLLTTGEVCVCHIHESLRMSQPKASRHLAYLRQAGLVTTRREGLWVYYRLASAPDTLTETIRDAVVHAVGHAGVVRKDIERLQRRTGCCLPAADDSGSYACCRQAENNPCAPIAAGG